MVAIPVVVTEVVDMSLSSIRVLVYRAIVQTKPDQLVERETANKPNNNAAEKEVLLWALL